MVKEILEAKETRIVKRRYKRLGMLVIITTITVLGVAHILNASRNWAVIPQPGDRVWKDISVSEDGQTVAAGSDSQIFINTEGGSGTWNQVADPLIWQSVSVSDDGQTIVAAAQANAVPIISTNQGSTWSPLNTLPTTEWYRITLSGDASTIVAAGYGQDLQVSHDGGSTWQDESILGPVLSNSSIAVSDNGDVIAFTYSGGYVNVSTDGGATWQNPLASNLWTSIAMSGDGQKILVTAGYDSLYESADAGNSWNKVAAIPSSVFGNAVYVSDDGQVLALAPLGGYIYFSDNGGSTWAEDTNSFPLPWSIIAGSGDGQEIYAAAAGYGSLYGAQFGIDVPVTLTEVINVPSEISSASADYYFSTSDPDESGSYNAICSGGYYSSSVDTGTVPYSVHLSGLELGSTYTCSLNFLSAGGYSNTLAIGPFSVVPAAVPVTLTEVENVPSEVEAEDAIYKFTTSDPDEAGAYAFDVCDSATPTVHTESSPYTVTFAGLIAGHTYSCGMHYESVGGYSNTLTMGPFTVVEPELPPEDEGDEESNTNDTGRRKPSTRASVPSGSAGTGVSFSDSAANPHMNAPGGTPSVPVHDADIGARGSDVMLLQQLLITLNQGPASQALYDAGVTGFFGPLTQAALAEFQRQNGITPPAGYFGPKTRAFLKSLNIPNLWW